MVLLVSVICYTAPFTGTAQIFAYKEPLQQISPGTQAPNMQLKDAILALKTYYKVDIVFADHLVRDKLVPTNMVTRKKQLETDLREVLNLHGLTFRRGRGGSYIVLARKASGTTKEVQKPGHQASDHEQDLLTGTQARENRSLEVPGTETTIINSNHTVNGKIVDSETSEPLPGVNIVLKGTQQGTISDAGGHYTLVIPDDIKVTGILAFSYIGYKNIEIRIDNRSRIDVALETDLKSLDEVVVTAFGIEKEKRSISYSSQKINGEAISRVNNTNILNSLQGKVAGMTVRLPSGQPGSLPTVTIRGNRSISGSNSPIYVVDGQIITGNPGDLNPNDIEHINILKGANASALYGMLAANGAIVITTKNGSGLKKGAPVISIETGYNVDQITRLPSTQTTYAQGDNGVFNAFSANSWGPRIDEMGPYVNQLGETEQPGVYDNARHFFRNGGTYTANLDIGKSFDGGSFNVGTGYVNQQGIVPGTDFKRFTLKFGGTFNLNSRLTVGTSANISSSVANGVPPYGNSSLFYAAFFTPPTYNLRDKPVAVPGNPYEQINYRSAHDNIYWSIVHNSNNNHRTRVFGNVFASYKLSDWLSVNYRLGNDFSANTGKQVLSLGSGATGGRTNPPGGGRITNELTTTNVLNSNLNATLSKTFGQFDLQALLGGDLYHNNSLSNTSVGDNIIIGGFDNISNTTARNINESISRRRIAGVYSNIDVSWRNTVYLNLTGRKDKVSNLPSGNRSFFYPSVGTGIVLTEFLSLPDNLIPFAKIRASYAESGQAGNIYVQDMVFLNNGIAHGRSAGNFVFPFEGINAFAQSTTLIAKDLKPENTRITELGFDIRFLNNRLGLDYTYFNSKTENQIFDVPVPISTGFSVERRNGGAVSSRGHEIVITGKPLTGSGLNWDLTFNFSSYKNIVNSLAEGIERMTLSSVLAPDIVIERGRPYPIIRGTAYARDPGSDMIVVDSQERLSNGNVNPLYGMPLQANSPKELGTSIPDFEIGFINSLRYRSLSLDIQVDWRKGGQMYSSFNRLGSLYGMTPETINREPDDKVVLAAKKGFFDSNGNLVVEGDNDIQIVKGAAYYTGRPNTIHEAHVYDASFIRLREVRIAYSLPSKWVNKKIFREGSVYLTGRNLMLRSNVPNHDPEESSTSDSSAGTGQHLTYPQIRSFGGGIQMKF